MKQPTAREKAFKKVFGTFSRTPDNYKKFTIACNEEELELFALITDLLRKGIEFDTQIALGNLPADIINDTDDIIKEELNKFYSKTRAAYRSGKRYSFKEWVSVMLDIMDELD